MGLTQRQEVIFKTIVEQFTRSAEPVGSRTLLPLLDFPVSAATIRSEMAALEKEGLLEKTHTSSGRIPSRAGYLYYVEHLLETRLDPEMETLLKSVFKERHANIDDMIQTSCSILSEMTHLTSAVIGGGQKDQTLLQIQLIPISQMDAAAVFVTSTGHIQHRLFHIDSSVSMEDLTECTRLLNEQLAGTPVGEVIEKMKQLEPLMAARLVRFEMLYEAVFSAMLSMTGKTAKVFGRANMLAQPDLDRTQLEQLMRILENQSLFHKWALSPENVSVPFGRRSELIQIGDCSIVSARFQSGQGEEGQLMVIGPNRMPYSRLAALMDYMSSQIEDLLMAENQAGRQGGSSDEQE